ncbi:phosphate regulon sensor histidine kinase PhoR [Bartonella tamiae]|uniref:histidine kinase n=1 Tax=Bartonella tamiae Th239 TaxID=1094558 RepID=J0QYE7_9HYPH|nr:phosphate regulon sensor histidine kinase PhoR [Bartonella tamiae]EJF91136.1 phosphate regulon sensor kinase PhoR [Bartonella tamiae Th239]EJF93199.1 phosphate regulon sensor kinase PhoR [Bartonella tamiae Th307]
MQIRMQSLFLIHGIIAFFAVLFLPKALAAIIVVLLFFVIFWLSKKNNEQKNYDKNTQTIMRNTIRMPEDVDIYNLLDALPDSLFLLDNKNDIVFLNQTASKTFSRVVNGQNYITRFRAPELVNAVRRCQQMHQSVTVEYLDKKNNETFFIVLFVPLGGGQTLCLFRDRTETRRLERMRTDFIANASHELRTPLTSLRGFIETIRGPAKDDADTRDKFLTIMQDQAERMSRLIDDLLSLSRLEMKTGLDIQETVNFNLVLTHVVETLTPLAKQMGVVLALDLPSKTLFVQGRRDDLIQLFQNLIENACKYGQQGGKVDISVVDHKVNVELTVRDYGPGISEEHIPRLTERFYRVNAEVSRLHKGTGLGLAIVKHILSLHHGRLIVHSTLGEGSKFKVILPLKEHE